MTRKTHIGLMLILAAAIALGGCRDKKSGSSSQKPTGSETPKEALLNLIKAGETEDTDMFGEYVYVPDEAREFFETMLDATGTMMELNKVSQKAYGKKALPYVSIRNTNLPSAEEVEKMEFDVTEDKISIPSSYEPITLIRKDGRCFFDMSNVVPSAAEMKKTIQMAKAAVTAAETVMPKIGTEGYTFENMMEELANVKKSELARIMEEEPEAPRTETVTPDADDAPPVVRRVEPEDIVKEPEVTIKTPPVIEDAPVVVEVPATPATDAAAGPRAAMLKMAEAFKTMDMDAVLANTDINPKDKPYVEAMFKYVGALKMFERKLKTTYSSDDLKAAGFAFTNDDNIPTAKDIENMTFEVTGDTATATKKGEKPTKLVKKDGRWLLVFDDQLPQTEEREKIITQISMAGKILNGLMPKIGEKGVTAKNISEEYQAELLKAMKTLEQ